MTGLYDPQLVGFAIAIAVLTGFAALNLVQRVTLSRLLAARSWLTFGALLMGGGLWAMQLVTLLAYELPIEVVYHVPTLLFSLGISVLMCFFALWVAGAPRVGALRLAVAGLCMGQGLTSMYYSDVFAMQIVPAVFHDGRALAGSVLVAVVASILTLSVAVRLRDGITLLMLLARAVGGAVSGFALWWSVHKALAAARFAPDSYSLGAASSDGNGLITVLAVACALGVLTVMLLTIIDHARTPGGLTHLGGEDPIQREPVTGLANRLLLARRFDKLVDAPSHAHRHFALMLLEAPAPDFATPEVSQDVAREVARRLATLVRPGDTVARLEHGEFVLLLASLQDEELAPRIAARVLEEIGRDVALPEGVMVSMAPRIGISLYPRDGGDLDTLQRLARISVKGV